MAGSSDDNKNLALYCDFENIALGVRDAKYQKFDINHVLEKLLVKGSIVVKKAYCDWARYKDFKAPMHEASFELIDIPHVRQSGKNSADIRMVVDALDLCYTKSHVDTFVIISGDSDFSPLVSKLRENAKTVIGVGVKNSTSDLLINNCDEFIYYDDLVRALEKKKPERRRAKKRAARGSSSKDAAVDEIPVDGQAGESSSGDVSVDVNGDANVAGEVESGTSARKKTGSRSKRTRSRKSAARADVAESALTIDSADVELPGDGEEHDAGDLSADFAGTAEDDRAEELVQEGLDLVIETAEALKQDKEGNGKLWGSMIKQTLKRRRPGFNESYYGFDSFGKLLEEAQARGYLALELDDRSGGYIITKVSS